MYMQTFAAFNKNNEIRENSSSGGMFYEIAAYVIKNQGVVFGAKYDENWKVVHGHTETISGIMEFLGSKYVQSSILEEYAEVKKYLRAGKLVLFSGTPCQIGGLKSYLGQKEHNLITVDFICHGVPGPGVWKKYLEYRGGSRKIRKVNFRDKTEGWRRFSIKIEYEDGDDYRQNLEKDIYMKGFLQDIILRPSCYECQFKGMDRASDITLADYWGVWEQIESMYDDKGISLVFIHTQTGLEIWNEIRQHFKTEKIVDERVLFYNPSAIQSVVRPNKRDKFFSNGAGDMMLLKKMTHDSWFTRIKRIMKQIGRKLLRRY